MNPLLTYLEPTPSEDESDFECHKMIVTPDTLPIRPCSDFTLTTACSDNSYTHTTVTELKFQNQRLEISVQKLK